MGLANDGKSEAETVVEEAPSGAGLGLGLDEFLSGSAKGGESPSPGAAEETKPAVDPAPKTEKGEKGKPATDTKAAADPNADPNKAVDPNAPADPKTPADPALESLNKQLTDTRTWANNLNRDKLKLERDLAIAQKKLEGTYDPEVDGREEGAPVDPVVRKAEIQGKVNASIAAAKQMYGEEKVETLVTGKDSVFRRIEQADPTGKITERVLNSDNPILEAIDVIEEHFFHDKYGHRPKEVRENIRKELEAELTPKIKEQVTKELMAKFNLKEKVKVGLNDVRGSGTKADTDPKPAGQTPLAELFPL